MDREQKQAEDSSISDKAFFQAEAVNPIAEQSKVGIRARPQKEESEAEFAAEVSPAHGPEAGFGQSDRTGPKAGIALGYAALAVAIAAMFLLPSVLGPTAVVIGFMAFVRGSRALGVWSIVLGIVAFVSFLTTVAYSY